MVVALPDPPACGNHRDLHDAPAVEEAGIFPQSLWRHSHIRLTEEQFERARTLIEASARAVDAK